VDKCDACRVPDGAPVDDPNRSVEIFRAPTLGRTTFVHNPHLLLLLLSEFR
jgi:hypothetical protein